MATLISFLRGALLLAGLSCIADARPSKLLATSLFPDADSPYVGDAPIPIFGDKCAEVTVIHGAELDSYNKVVSAPYVPPSCSTWSQVVLRFDGAVHGVQFDRFGAVWLSGVEILRTTTPEPTAKGISWQIMRDITAVSPILRKPGNMTLQIPNVVNPTYTGVLRINISLEFYGPGNLAMAQPSPKLVRPLRNWNDTEPSIFQTGVNGNETQSNLLSNLPQNMVQATLEVFASGHGCEEFWYTNLPDVDTPKGGCGGGAYREIEVYVDGVVAGVAYPFPVIYTGGVNPLLWRPLTGIASFDVPPYSFDLSPFLGILNDGQTHNISLTVRQNNNAGVWYLDAVLHAELDPTASVLTGKLLHHSDIRPPIRVKRTVHGNTTLYITEAHRDVKVVGSLQDSQNRSHRILSVAYSLQARNNNTLVGPPLQVSDGWMRSTTTQNAYDGNANSDNPQESRTYRSWFPYFVSDLSNQDNTTFEIGPTKVNYTRVRSVDIQKYRQPHFQLEISDGINATALYNRSLTNHSLVYKQQGTSEEVTGLRAGTKPSSCYTRHLAAANGYTTFQHNTTETCDWQAVPSGFYTCGLAFCEQLDGLGRSAKSFLPAVRSWFDSGQQAVFV